MSVDGEEVGFVEAEEVEVVDSSAAVESPVANLEVDVCSCAAPEQPAKKKSPPTMRALARVPIFLRRVRQLVRFRKLNSISCEPLRSEATDAHGAAVPTWWAESSGIQR